MARTDPDLVIALARYNRAMDAERRELTNHVTAIVERHLGAFETLDLMTYDLRVRPRLMYELDGVLSQWYGRFPGDRSARLLTLIRDQRRRAFAQPFVRDAKDVARRLKRFPEVLRAVKAEAG